MVLSAVLVLLLLAAAATAEGDGCPARCSCSGGGERLECRGAGLRSVPPLTSSVLYLDLSGNEIVAVARDALRPAVRLRDLNLSGNRLEWVAGGALSPSPHEDGDGDGDGEEEGEGGALEQLWLDDCGLRRLPTHALRLPRLRYLSAADNALHEVEGAALGGVRALRGLRLARNLLRAVPAAALAHVTRLSLLDLADNRIEELSADSLPPLRALHTLVLRRNRIAHIDDAAFAGTPAVARLHLEDNLLKELPGALRLLPLLQLLDLSRNAVEEASSGALEAGARLERLELGGNPLSRLHRRALPRLPRLHTLVVSDSRGLRALPPLEGAARLHTLRAARCGLRAAPPDLCRTAPHLVALDLRYNLLERMPELHGCSRLRLLEVSDNRIATLDGRTLRGAGSLRHLAAARNLLRRVTRDSFRHTPALVSLDLEGNLIEHIDTEAFTPIAGLEELNVGDNRFPRLPAAGLQHLRHLRAHNNPNLRHFHPPELLPRIQTLVLSYAYHCCEFLPLMAADDTADYEEGAEGRFTDVVVPVAWGNATDLRARLNASGLDAELQAALREWGPAEWGAWGAAADGGADRGAAEESDAPELRAPRPPVRCVPLPGPFLPCADLFEWWTLRCGVWAVFLLALLGNGTVVFVLVFSRSRIDVPRFLVTNLAAADFFMGLYLGLLAVVDAGTLGEFRAHAIGWQMSGACRLAGFLGVLSSELSVYTLAVITLERNYAITHAMHLNKRLSLRHATAVMAAGWAFSLAAATLPLVGVSDYRKFAVCLPFETESPAALGYVVALLAVNGLAFLVLLGCYLKMYCAIRGSQAWNSNDSRIAKRMALLVFTDFLCWSPIAFFALTAAFGARLVSLEEAKVFTVFVLPLNSCCNPFLYAILTKQFKKDCALVCKAIEESRVTRGIGRCRHSSNFSNRQTPANTNSLNERSSRGPHAPACACRRLLPPEPAALAAPAAAPRPPPAAPLPLPPPPPPAGRVLRWLRACRRRASPAPPSAARAPAAAPARAGSVSSSVEFSSSRSDSWRAYGRPPPPRRAASWLVARKTSQDSNLSSSRNDSSGSNATASTGTWRTSRSAPGAAAGAAGAAAAGGARPRLTRQPAVSADEPPLSPGGCGPALPPPRPLPTIPSAAEGELPPEEPEPR